MKGKWIWILYFLNMLMFVCYLTGCGSDSKGSNGEASKCDWAYPKSITWYGTTEGITWQNPRHVKYEREDFIRITAQDGTPFLIYGRTVSEGEK